MWLFAEKKTNAFQISSDWCLVRERFSTAPNMKLCKNPSRTKPLAVGVVGRLSRPQQKAYGRWAEKSSGPKISRLDQP